MRNPTLRRPLAAVLGLAALGGLATAAPPDRTVVDEVIYLDGTQQKTRTGGAVESHGYDQVVYLTDRGKVTIAGPSVVEIRWGDATPDWGRGWRALTARDGAEARKTFDSLLLAFRAKPDMRPWIGEYAQLGLGEAHLLLATNDRAAAGKAVEAFEAAREANPKSLELHRILSGLAEAHLMQDKDAEALRAADDLVAAGKQAQRPAWELQGLLLRARVSQQEGNAQAALSALDDVIRFAQGAAQAAKTPEARASLRRSEVDAAVRKGWVLMEKALASRAAADFQAAESQFSGLTAAYPDEPGAHAAAANSRGVRLLASGQPADALRALQETEVRHFAVPEEVARSLYYQAQAHKELGDETLRAERLRDLKEFYPKSEWARKAQ